MCAAVHGSTSDFYVSLVADAVSAFLPPRGHTWQQDAVHTLLDSLPRALPSSRYRVR